MSKAPGAVEDYDGSGAWFKTFDWGMISSLMWNNITEVYESCVD
jgi:hypothetical protein